MHKPVQNSRAADTAIAICIIAAVGICDYFSGYQITLSVFYLFGICYALWKVGPGSGIAMAVLSIAISEVADWLDGIRYARAFVPVWNACITVAFYLIVIWLLNRIKLFQTTLEDRIRQRTAALASEVAKRERLEKEILMISEREQRRIGHELHDTLCQHLTGTAIAGQVLADTLCAEKRAEADDAGQIVDLVEEGIEMARNLARGLFPVGIEGEGLLSALRELAETHDGRAGIVCRFEAANPALIQDGIVAAHLYRIGQESVRNAVRHSAARHITISLDQDGEEAVLSIRDDGSGFGPAVGERQGMGLHIMRHRATLIGGQFEIASNGNETVVSCVVRNGLRPT
ncbi:MAG TPA: sensor histidine kinase [Chthoniobacteraceae bacterium]|jgi:signal transduction histidine kinase|nr:sensor histidine kinase [Chthoniobacteraceae bacterium]